MIALLFERWQKLKITKCVCKVMLAFMLCWTSISWMDTCCGYVCDGGGCSGKLTCSKFIAIVYFFLAILCCCFCYNHYNCYCWRRVLLTPSPTAIGSSSQQIARPAKGQWQSWPATRILKMSNRTYLVSSKTSACNRTTIIYAITNLVYKTS